jgi:hypothetical protein
VTTLSASVVVSASSPLAVSDRFFGQNYWSWVPTWGDPVAGVQAKTATLGLRLLRAGGANNDKQNPAPFTLDEVDGFIAFAQAVGAAPLLQVPLLKNLSAAAATAQDAAALVTYVNVTKGYGIKYFAIGNEPDLYTEQGFFDATYSASTFCATFRSFASAMKAVDPTISIVGPDLSWKYQSGANDWLTPFLTECGDVVDIVAVHRYPLAPTACTEAAAYADAVNFRATVSHLRDVMKNTGQASKPLAMTEANITWDGDPTKSTMPASPGTFPAGLWVADNLGVALESGLHSVSYWSLSEGWTLGFFNGTTPRPAFYIFELFTEKFGTEVLKVSGAPAGTSVYAGRDAAAQKTSVFVLNKTNQRLELSVTLEGLPRTIGDTVTAEPISIVVAELPDDDAAPKLTAYSAAMSAPTAL